MEMLLVAMQLIVTGVSPCVYRKRAAECGIVHLWIGVFLVDAG
jgi:hypothetical protein